MILATGNTVNTEKRKPHLFEPTQRAFTLIEILVVMAIMAVLFSATLLSFRSLALGDSGEKWSKDFSAFTQRARRASGQENNPVSIYFTKELAAIVAGDEEELQDNSRVLEELEIPSELSIKIKRWNSDKWVEADRQSWRIPAGNIIEPVALRILGEKDSVTELHFDALSALPLPHSLLQNNQ